MEWGIQVVPTTSTAVWRTAHRGMLEEEARTPIRPTMIRMRAAVEEPMVGLGDSAEIRGIRISAAAEKAVRPSQLRSTVSQWAAAAARERETIPTAITLRAAGLQAAASFLFALTVL